MGRLRRVFPCLRLKCPDTVYPKQGHHGATHDFEAERGFFEERAAIIEFDAGVDRAHAERLAWDETLARFFAGDATSIVKRASADGVEVIRESGCFRLSGPRSACDSWRPTIPERHLRSVAGRS